MSTQEFSVKTVCRLTGLNEHTLRAWERRYQAILPRRLENGRRIYTTADVERLRRLIRLVDQGHAIGRIAGLAEPELASLLVRSDELAEVPPPPPDGGSVRSRAAAEVYAARIGEALVSYDLARVQRELATARARFGARDFMLGLISPLMAKVGKMIVEGGFGIGQEHALSAIVKAHLLDILFHLGRSRDHGGGPAGLSVRSVVAATMEGDLHEIGLLVGGILCADSGLIVHYIGPNIPAEPLADTVHALKADAVLLGMSSLPPGILPVAAPHYLAQLSAKLARRCEIWVGGEFEAALGSVRLQNPLRLLPTFQDLDALLT